MPTKAFFKLDEEKRERIVRAAIDEFHKCGFDKANVGIIAQNADIAKGSIYWYFENKKEVFLYSVHWTLEFFMKKIDINTPLKDMDIFDYFLSGLEYRASLIKEEYTLTLFSQDIMSGKFGSLTGLADEEMWRLGDEYMVRLIENGKKKGIIRSDLDNGTLMIFIKGVTSKFEEYIFSQAVKDDFNVNEEKIKSSKIMIDNMLLLLKEGIGGKNVH